MGFIEDMLESDSSEDWSGAEPYLRALTPTYIWNSVPLSYLRAYMEKVSRMWFTSAAAVPVDTVVRVLFDTGYIIIGEREGTYDISSTGETLLEKAIFGIKKDDDRHTKFVLDSLRFLGRLFDSPHFVIVPGFKMRNVSVIDASGKVLLVPDLLLYLDDNVISPRALGFASYIAVECQREDAWKLRDKLKTYIASIRYSPTRIFPLFVVRDEEAEQFGSSKRVARGEETRMEFERGYLEKQSTFISDEVSSRLDRVVPWRKPDKQEETISSSPDEYSYFSRPLSDYFYNVLYLSWWGDLNTWKVPVDPIVTISNEELADASLLSSSFKKIMGRVVWH